MAAPHHAAAAAQLPCPLPTALPLRLQGSLGEGTYFYAGAFWLLALWGVSAAGCLLLRAYTPRLDKRYVGHIE